MANDLIKYLKSLPENKQPQYGKIGSNTSYDYLIISINDPLIPGKMFFEGVARNLNELLTLVQTDKCMALFLTETPDSFIRFFMEKFFLKKVVDQAHSFISLSKIDLTDITK